MQALISLHLRVVQCNGTEAKKPQWTLPEEAGPYRKLAMLSVGLTKELQGLLPNRNATQSKDCQLRWAEFRVLRGD